VTLSRRATLEWMAAVSFVTALPRGIRAAASAPNSSPQITSGYGTDPNLKEPVVPWPLVMEPYQLKLTAALADLILPASAAAPAASVLGVAEFINEWVSAPYSDQVKDRTRLIEGLRWIDAESVRRGQRNFLESDSSVRQGIMNDIGRKPPRATYGVQSLFFNRFRFLVVSSYYTTPDGFEDIGYTGNIPLAAYPPMTDEERTILDGALSKLGVSRTSKGSSG
jgi:hypothetical protein